MTLKRALLELEPTLILQDLGNSAIRVSLPGGPGMRLHPDYYEGISEDPVRLRAYAERIIEKLRKEVL